ncbi:hypothetical protein [Streptomyces sp. NPDC090112]|uniref:hypothetical protein n=1 Tax=Streptomyces sp. NPDC090112 TaxID=3365949 RepID=UPI003810D5AA
MECLLAERACERLVVEFVHRLDLGDPLPPPPTSPPTRVDGYSEGLVPPQPPVQVSHYEDTFRKVDHAWHLTTRTLFLSFAGPTERLDGPTQS